MGGFFLLATSLMRGGIADLLCCFACSLEWGKHSRRCDCMCRTSFVIFYFWCILCCGFMHNDEVEITYFGFSCFIRQVDSWRAVKMLLPGAPRSVLPMSAVFGGILDEAGERDLTFLVMRNPWLLRYLVLRDWGFNSTITCSIDKLASTIIL